MEKNVPIREKSMQSSLVRCKLENWNAGLLCNPYHICYNNEIRKIKGTKTTTKCGADKSTSTDV